MKIMDKIKKATGAEDEQQYQEVYDNADYEENFDPFVGGYADAPTQDVNNMGMGQGYPSGGIAGSTSYPPSSQGFGAVSGGISLSGNAIEIMVVQPEKFESATRIADQLLANRTINLNLEKTNKETARRLIDFLSGVVYSIKGSIQKSATNSYVIAPANVKIGKVELKDKAAKAAPAEAEEPVEEPVENDVKPFPGF